MKEMTSGAWKYSHNIDDLVSPPNIYKIIKSATLENGIKYAFSTGNWGMKNSVCKAGVPQVVNRLSFQGFLSHLRRISTPIDKTSKLIQPRQLHITSWGYVCPAETPEGGSVGGVKNIALTCEITIYQDPCIVYEILSSYKGDLINFDDEPCMSSISNRVVIMINGNIYGFTDEPYELCLAMRSMRRKGILHPHTSVTFNIRDKEILIHTEAGRVTRPLIILENGKTRFTQESLDDLIKGELEWDHLISGFTNTAGDYVPSVIEYIDASETESCVICMDKETFSKSKTRYTHLEIHPSLMLGSIASSIPFPDHNPSPRNTYQSAMGKQAMGIYTSNFLERMDTMGNILTYPSLPHVTTRLSQYTLQDKSPNGCNVRVAIMCYSGFNMEDSIIFNESSLDRGLFHSTFYRVYKDEEKKNQLSGEEEKFKRPSANETRGMKPGSYQTLDEAGLAILNKPVKGGDVIIGKVIPLKISVANTGINNNKAFRDQSTTLRHNESGVIDRVFVNRNSDGYRFCKVSVRTSRKPCIGDKFSSRHGQKGTVGMIFKEEDMPFSSNGLHPDVIINPHAVPSRMTIGQLIECIMGKTCCELGIRGDGTPFTSLNLEKLYNTLQECGLQKHGNEVMYNGMTGKQIKCDIFVGDTFYQRLKHMVDDKIHSRSTGPRVLLTRQPAEGRARDGGLRFGEMERDCMIAHGTGIFLKERMTDMSDNFRMKVSRETGLISAINKEKNIYNNFTRDDEDAREYDDVCVPYAFKLLMQELQAMGIASRIIT
jgi:DNA-directed RNA polymerase II subunit RPB2